MDAIINEILGKNGIIAVVGIMFFMASYKYSVKIFDAIENHTVGTKDYILEKLELLHLEANPQKIVYLLLFLSFGNAILVLGFLSIVGLPGLGVVLAIIVSIVGWKIPRPLINYLVERRIKLYESQMVDGLTLLANGLRAGLSVPQSIGMVVDELPAPLSQEFNMILQQNKIGVPLEECFENLVKRVPTEDNEMFVTSVNILRETGGNLAETFDTIVAVIRERVRLKQKIETFIAQGMFQGITIFCMPFVIGLIYAASDPESMKPMFTTPLGLVMATLALGLDCLGFYFILKVVKIKV